MNTHRMLLLADLLENLEPKRFNIYSWFSEPENGEFSYIDPEQFNAYDCGTAACIAGWASVMENDFESISVEPGEYFDTEDRGAKYLGLTINQARELFFYSGEYVVWNRYRDQLNSSSDEEVSNLDAATALRNLATGKWEFHHKETLV